MLLRFDLFRDLDRLAREILGAGRMPQPIPMDCYRDGDTFILHFDLLGIDPETLEVSENGDMLTVRAQRRTAALDLESITAGYHDGVLTLTIPVAERVKPRRLDVGRVQDGSAALPTAGHRWPNGPPDAAAPPAGAATSWYRRPAVP